MKRYLPVEQATAALARELWQVLPSNLSGWILLLRGDLGAGTSTFARALIAAAGHAGAVPSPTYTLVEPYRVSSNSIYHVDLYRVSDEEELEYLGWSDLDDGFCIIEWPERAPGLLQHADLELRLTYQDGGRFAELRGLSSRGTDVTDAMEDSDSES